MKPSNRKAGNVLSIWICLIGPLILLFELMIHLTIKLLIMRQKVLLIFIWHWKVILELILATLHKETVVNLVIVFGWSQPSPIVVTTLYSNSTLVFEEVSHWRKMLSTAIAINFRLKIAVTRIYCEKLSATGFFALWTRLGLI